MTVWWTDGIDNKIITEHQATFATSEKDFFVCVFLKCNWQMSHYSTFFRICLFYRERYPAETFLWFYNQKVTRSNPSGTVESCPLCSATPPLHLHHIITPSARHRTRSAGVTCLIIALRHSVFDYSCLGVWSQSDHSCCLVFLQSHPHKKTFFCFWHTGLPMEPYLCVNISVWRFVRGVIIDGSEACLGVIAFAWQPGV